MVKYVTIWMESVLTCFKVQTWNSPGTTEGIPEILQYKAGELSQLSPAKRHSFQTFCC